MGRSSSPRPHRLFGRVAALIVATAVVAGAAAHATLALTEAIAEPPVPVLCLIEHFIDQSPVSIAIGAGWERIRLQVPAWRVRGDRTLWLQMRLEHWNNLPRPLRESGLLEMFRSYPQALAGPDAWISMGPLDWDEIPQPVRAMAVLRMVDERVAQAAPTGAHGLAVSIIAETVGAIIMVESWFEHRAVNVNSDGKRDLGLAQASAYCRRRLVAVGLAGSRPANTLTDDEYFDPWKAAGVATWWFLMMLNEADGDRELAVRAYHRGIGAARTGVGQDYLEQVEAKRLRFIRNSGAPAGWRFAFERYRRHAASPSGDPSIPTGLRSSGSDFNRIRQAPLWR